MDSLPLCAQKVKIIGESITKNVHDSHGAREFILACIRILKQELPWLKIEVRMDSAFFSDAIVSTLVGMGIEFPLSVPFERFVELKRRIQDRAR